GRQPTPHGPRPGRCESAPPARQSHAGSTSGRRAAALGGARADVTGPRVRDLLERKGDLLQLEALTGDLGLDRLIPTPEASGPGLVLACDTQRFAAQRIRILREPEVTSLDARRPDARRKSAETLVRF